MPESDVGGRSDIFCRYGNAGALSIDLIDCTVILSAGLVIPDGTAEWKVGDANSDHIGA